MIAATGDPRTQPAETWLSLPSVSALPPHREVYGFTANGAR